MVMPYSELSPLPTHLGNKRRSMKDHRESINEVRLTLYLRLTIYNVVQTNFIYCLIGTFRS